MRLPCVADVNRVWVGQRQRNLSLFIRPNQVTALLQPLTDCTGDELLVVVVPSASANIKRRNAIRNTWGQWLTRSKRSAHRRRSLNSVNGQDFPDQLYSRVRRKRSIVDESPKINSIEKKKPSYNANKNESPIKTIFTQLNSSLSFKLVFLLGRDSERSDPSLSLLEEQEKHGDIILEDFLDTYQNLTVKSVFMLKYIRDSCPGTKFVAKIDDDIFLHVPNLQNTLLDETLPQKLLLGCLFCNARPIANRWNKWYSPPYMYRGEKYPNYLSGTSYVISTNLVKPLLKAALETPLFHLEDVFITGILAKKLSVRLTDNKGFSYQSRPLNPCLYQVA